MRRVLLFMALAMISLTINAQQLSPNFVRQHAPVQKATVAENSMEYGYCGEFTLSLGFGMKGTMRAVMEVPAADAAKYAGVQITTVKVGLGTFASTPNAQLLILPDLDGSEPIYSQSFTPVSNKWNEVVLETPYTIGQDGFFVGYQIDCTANNYPFGIDEETANPLGDYVGYYDAEEGAFMYLHLGSEGFGNNSIKLVLTGDNLPQYDLVLEDVSVKQYVKTGDVFSLTGQVKNAATQTINTFDVTYQIGDAEAQTQTITAYGGLANAQTYTFSIDNLVINEDGTKNITVTISNPNGMVDESEADNTVTKAVTALSTMVPRKVLLENFSTAQCGNCPRVHELIKDILSERNDVAYVVHHSGFGTDTYTIDESKEYLWFYGGGTYTPAAMLDRRCLKELGAEGAQGVVTAPVFFPNSKESLTEYINYCAEQPAFISINITDVYNEENRELTVRVYGECAIELAQIPRINIFLTENGLVGYQSGGGNSYIHSHAIRKVMTSTWGDQLTFDSSNKFDVTYTCVLDEDWKAENMSVVAFVADFNEKNYNECIVHNSEWKPLEYKTESAPEPIPSVQFVYNGKVLENGAVVEVLEYDASMGEMPWHVEFKNNTGKDVEVIMSYQSYENKYPNLEGLGFGDQMSLCTTSCVAGESVTAPSFIVNAKGEPSCVVHTGFGIMSDAMYGYKDAYVKVDYKMVNANDEDDFTNVTVVYDYAKAISENKPKSQLVAEPIEVVKVNGIFGQDEISLPISLINTNEIAGLQCDIFLPDGLTPVMQGDKYDVVLSSRAEGFDVTAKLRNDGALRVVVVSTDTTDSIRAISGNEGELFTIKLKPNEQYSTDDNIAIRNIVMTGSDYAEYEASDVIIPCKIKESFLGDVNRDGKVNVTDVIVTIGKVLNVYDGEFDTVAADIDQDGEITIVDVVGIINLVLDESDTPSQARMQDEYAQDALTMQDVKMSQGETKDLVIGLTNEAPYTAFQMDVTLPAGLNIEHIALSGRANGHTLQWQAQADGSVRIVGYALDNATIADNDGALLTLTVSSDSQFETGEVMVSNTIFSTRQLVSHRLERMTAKVSNITALNDVVTATRIYATDHKVVVDSPVAQEAAISTIDGVVQRVALQAGCNEIPLQQGVYIVAVDAKVKKVVIR